MTTRVWATWIQPPYPKNSYIQISTLVWTSTILTLGPIYKYKQKVLRRWTNSRKTCVLATASPTRVIVALKIIVLTTWISMSQRSSDSSFRGQTLLFIVKRVLLCNQVARQPHSLRRWPLVTQATNRPILTAKVESSITVVVKLMRDTSPNHWQAIALRIHT